MGSGQKNRVERRIRAWSNNAKRPSASRPRAMTFAEMCVISSGRVKWEATIRRYCDLVGFSYGDMIGPSRKEPLVSARQVAMWAVLCSGGTLKEAAHAVGRSNHSTVISAAKKIRAELALHGNNPRVEQYVSAAKEAYELH